MGRLHQKKGVQLLLQAWSRLRSRYPGAHLIVAGPDSDGTLPRLVSYSEEVGLGSSVTFAGMLIGELKWSLLSRADLFVLPSYSEGFSVAVLESLACGTPVVVTRQCNFSAVSTSGAGWVIEPDAEAVESAIDDALSLSRRDTDRMRLGARALSDCYAWPVIGSHFAALYHWLLGGPKPDRIEIV
jgi:glycosyltransferase involved in cell wall biosynthesis